MSLEKKTLIIGGSQGLGSVLAKHFFDQGHQVSIVSRRIPSSPEEMTHFKADLCSEHEVLSALDKIKTHYTLLDNIIFLQRYRGEGDTWDNEFNVSLTATKTIINTLQDHFTNEGSIVMVTSVADYFIGDEQPAQYHVAKAGLSQLARYYAVTLGTKNIRCNSVSPSIFIKDRTQAYHESEQRTSLYKKIIPLGRAAKAIEICNVIDFLCSNKASYITGQNITVDGGLSVQAHLTLAEKLLTY